MLDVSIQQMKYAVEIARTGSISQAAKNLYMNQPNLSKSLKELESSLGAAVFVRTPKGVLPTAEGKIFLESAGEILMKLEQLEEKIRDRKENNASFNISIPRATYITHAFTEFVRGIQETREIRINYRETNTAEAVENILHQGFDMGIIRYPLSSAGEFEQMLARKGLVTREVWLFEYLLLMSKEHPLAGKQDISLEELEEYTELVHGDEKYEREKLINAMNRRIYLYERGSQFDLLRNVPTTYMWVSPLPVEVLEGYGLVQVKCAERSEKYRDALVYHSDYQFSQFAGQFISTLLRVKEEIQTSLEKQ